MQLLQLQYASTRLAVEFKLASFRLSVTVFRTENVHFRVFDGADHDSGYGFSTDACAREL